MGDRRSHHSAVEGVMNLLIKANHDLSLVKHHLDHEFQANYPDHIISSSSSLSYNPRSLIHGSSSSCLGFCNRVQFMISILVYQANSCKLVARIKRIQEDLVSLKDLCRDLLKEKLDLVDKATTLFAQGSSLQRLLASSGLPLINEFDKTAYTNLNQLCLKMQTFASNSGDVDSKIVRETWLRILDQALSRGGATEACATLKRVGSNIYPGDGA